MVFSTDPVVDALLASTADVSGRMIWFAEEGLTHPALQRRLLESGAAYVSNRFDQVCRMKALGVIAAFHDFERDRLPLGGVDHIFFRIAKQRPLVHHLINLSVDLLRPGGSLWLAGLKGEGIKTHARRAGERLGQPAERLRADRGAGIYRIQRGQPGASLEDMGYADLRRIKPDSNLSFWSKPGIYGWDKVDAGSRSLADLMCARHSQLEGQRVLDLGCGYGYLALRAAELHPDRLVATDNQAAAVAAAGKNLDGTCANVEVTADDCGANLRESFNLILCNPPFHQGFSTTDQLHHKFMSSIARLLAPRGEALVVVNGFLNLEPITMQHGLQILETLPSPGGSFSVLVLGRNRAGHG